MAERRIPNAGAVQEAMRDSGKAKELSMIGDLVSKVGTGVADAALGIIDKQDKVKMSKNLSQMNLDVNDLFMTTQEKYKDDPLSQDALDFYATEARKIEDKYAAGVSPLNQSAFQANLQKVNANYAKQYKTWAAKQAVKNTEGDIKDTIANNNTLLYRAGLTDDYMNLANIQSNFNDITKNMTDIAASSGVLSAEQVKDFVDSMKSDGMVSYLTGLINTAPNKALGFLGQEAVLNDINSPKKAQSLRNAAKAQIEKVKREKTHKDVTDVMTFLGQLGQMPYEDNPENIQLVYENLKTIGENLKGTKPDFEYVATNAINKYLADAGSDLGNAYRYDLENFNKQETDFAEQMGFIINARSEEELADFVLTQFAESNLSNNRKMILLNAAVKKVAEGRMPVSKEEADAQTAPPPKKGSINYQQATSLATKKAVNEAQYPFSSALQYLTGFNVPSFYIERFINYIFGTGEEPTSSEIMNAAYRTNEEFQINEKYPEIRGKAQGDTVYINGEAYIYQGFDPKTGKPGFKEIQ